MQDFESEILQTFLDESTESLGAWERSCLALGQGDDAAAVAQLFRCAHNMKGSAKSVGLAALGSFIHVVEDLILKVKSGDMTVTPEVGGVLLDCEAFLRGWLEGLRGCRTLVLDTAPTLDRIAALCGASESIGEFANPFQDAKEGDIIFADDMPPAPKQVDTVRPQTNSKSSAESVRVPAARIDELIQLVGELSIQSSIIAHARTTGSLTSEVSLGAIDLLAKLARELQTRSLGFRMQPLQNTMQRLERVARDVARELGKDVEVSVEGQDVELDKTVIERMTDPLVHMVRNALDHGVETETERKASGKNYKARVSFTARRNQMASRW